MHAYQYVLVFLPQAGVESTGIAEVREKLRYPYASSSHPRGCNLGPVVNRLLVNSMHSQDSSDVYIYIHGYTGIFISVKEN